MSKRLKWWIGGIFAVQLLLLITAAWLVFFYPTDGGTKPITYRETSGMAKFEVRSDKADLEKVINSYLSRNVESKKLTYSVELDDRLHFRGDVRVLGRIVPLEISFEPEVMENGNLLLKQDYFKVGGLRLPRSLVLEYVKNSYSFPEWIHIQPSQRQILLASSTMDTESGMIIRVREFDLAADDLRYEVFLP